MAAKLTNCQLAAARVDNVPFSTFYFRARCALTLHSILKPFNTLIELCCCADEPLKGLVQTPVEAAEKSGNNEAEYDSDHGVLCGFLFVRPGYLFHFLACFLNVAKEPSNGVFLLLCVCCHKFEKF